VEIETGLRSDCSYLRRHWVLQCLSGHLRSCDLCLLTKEDFVCCTHMEHTNCVVCSGLRGFVRDRGIATPVRF
jgi:hypothetical protein